MKPKHNNVSFLVDCTQVKRLNVHFSIAQENLDMVIATYRERCDLRREIEEAEDDLRASLQNMERVYDKLQRARYATAPMPGILEELLDANNIQTK
jgi:hypothetical protein